MSEVERKEKEQRDKDPLLICRLIAQHPKRSFVLTLAGHAVFILVTVILFLVGYDIFPVEFNSFPLEVKQDITARREYAWAHRDDDDPDKINRIPIDSVGPWWDRGHSIDDVSLHFKAKSSDINIFTKESFQEMKDIEQRLFSLESYQTNFCQLGADMTCLPLVSVLRYFDGTYSKISDVFYDPDFTNITAVLFEAYTHPDTRDNFRFFLPKGYNITEQDVFGSLTRSVLPCGWPLGDGSESEQHKKVENFLNKELAKLLDEIRSEMRGDMDLYYTSWKMFTTTVFDVVLIDMFLAIGSLLFIFAFMWLQTGSFMITGLAVLSIISCFVTTNFIYRIILDYRYIGYFHMIAIFIILGIGADDFFVFYNTWRNTKGNQYLSPAHRLSHCYRRAAGTMFFTSFTTMMAFIAGAISPFLPISSFGVFTGMLIGVNYISVITFFPTVIFLHHNLGFDRACCTSTSEKVNHSQINLSDKTVNGYHTDLSEIDINLSTPCGSMTTLETTKDAHQTGSLPSAETKSGKLTVSYQNGFSSTSAAALFDSSVDQGTSKPASQKDADSLHIISRFFRGYYYHIISHRVIRWIIIIIFLAAIAFFIWSATRLEPDTDEVKIYKPDFHFGQAMELENRGYIPSGDNFVTIYLVWGLMPADVSKCHKTDFKCTGKQEWDETFDLNNPPTQLALQNLCQEIKYTLNAGRADSLMIRSSHTGEREVDCFLDDMEAFLQSQQTETALTVNISIPLTERKMYSYMRAFPSIYESDKLDKSFYRYLEIGVSNWLSSGYSMLSSPDFHRYDSLVGESRDGNNTLPVKAHINTGNSSDIVGWYGTRLRYATIRVNLSLTTQELSYMKGLPVMDEWENFFTEKVSNLPLPLRGGFQVTEGTWHWLTVQRTLSVNAILGIVIGLAIALPVLILATMNFITGLFATILIGCITATAIGVLPLAGWKLDILVSMNLCLLVGLSVDYIVHLAEGYHLSEHSDRRGRVRDMLGHLGVSVISGAFTTIGAAIFMLFTKILFFIQFGTFLLSTIGFSLLLSLVFFSTVMNLCGPEGEQGSLYPVGRFIKKKLKSFLLERISETQDPKTSRETNDKTDDSFSIKL